MLNRNQTIDAEKQIETLQQGLCPYCGRTLIDSHVTKDACCRNNAIACKIVMDLKKRKEEDVEE